MKKKKMRRRQIIGKMLAFVLTASILLGNNSLLVLAQEGTSAPIEVTTVDAGEDMFEGFGQDERILASVGSSR